jgi:hypothetical protein
MAQAQPGLHIDRWMSGLFTNRAATSTPFRYSYGRAILFHDALIDGANTEITPANTLARRPGYPIYDSVGFNGTEVVTGFTSAILNGLLYDFVDTTQNVYLFTSSSLTSIYTKTTTAQTRYQQVGNVLYFSDGASNLKVSIDTLGNVSVTNAGIVAPTAAPMIPNLNLYDGSTQTTHAWVAGASYANTTGSAKNYYVMAPTGEIYWAVVPGGTTNTSGVTLPNWAAGFGIFGAVVSDGTMTWTNCLAPNSWAAGTVYATKTFSLNHPVSALNTIQSIATSGSGAFANWTASGSAYGCVNSSGHTGSSNTLKITGLGLGVPAGATIKGVQVTVFKGANRSNAVADTTVQLLKAGSAAGSNKALAGFWPQILFSQYTIPTSGGVRTTYGSNTDLWGTTLTPSDVNNSGFGVQIVANQTSTRTTSFGLTPDTNNNNVIADVTVYYTVAASDITGTAYQNVVTDSNGNLQMVTTGGTSGSTTPTWSSTIGGTTTDGTVTWTCIGTANQIPCLFSRTYAYGFHSSGATNHLSTLSPTLTVQAPIIGSNVTLQALGSSDTQVDRNDLYRTLDGGGLLLYDTSTANVNGSTNWTIADTALDADLNYLLTGPVAHVNDPPPAGMTNITFFMGRMWGAVGNLLYFSGGPDTVNGDGSQAWPPANVFTFAGPINGFAPTSQGLIVLTANDLSVVLGGPQTDTFWVQPLIRNFGVLSPNCVAQEADDVVVYTTQSQLFSISPQGKNELGFNVAPTLATNFNPASSYLAIHRSGQDQGLFISNGSTKVLRYNMNAESWDTLATPANGFGPIASIDTAIGTRSLVSAASSTNIVKRDPTVFADSGTAYSAFATIGSIVLSEPGEPAVMVKSVVVTSAAVGTNLVIAVLPNEISGSFTTIPFAAADPFQLPASSSLNMKRYDWKGVQTPLAQIVKHLQVKLTLPATDTVKNEIFTLGVMQ